MLHAPVEDASLEACGGRCQGFGQIDFVFSWATEVWLLKVHQLCDGSFLNQMFPIIEGWQAYHNDTWFTGSIWKVFILFGYLTPDAVTPAFCEILIVRRIAYFESAHQMFCHTKRIPDTNPDLNWGHKSPTPGRYYYSEIHSESLSSDCKRPGGLEWTSGMGSFAWKRTHGQDGKLVLWVIIEFGSKVQNGKAE